MRQINVLRNLLLSQHRPQGKGVDRHLFALLCMAKKKAEEARAAAAAAKEAVPNGGDSNGTPPPSPPSQIPALFEDEAWRVLNHVILSTRCVCGVTNMIRYAITAEKQINSM